MRVDVMQHYGFTQPLSHAGYYETAHHRHKLHQHILYASGHLSRPDFSG